MREVFGVVSRRADRSCNFVDVPGGGVWGADTKLVYRHYATLYFVFAVDSSESELGILDLIQVFVETLDKCFENVCELDLIFHMDKIHYILDEIVQGGLVLETQMPAVVAALVEQKKVSDRIDSGGPARPGPIQQSV
jgi:AP-3 complex subunit sigma